MGGCRQRRESGQVRGRGQSTEGGVGGEFEYEVGGWVSMSGRVVGV